jgi:hypothetical protein
MHFPMLTLAAATLALGLTGCDYNAYTDNGEVTVKNRTLFPITVHYDTEEVVAATSCGDVETELVHHHATIKPAGEATLQVHSLGLWDAIIDVDRAGLIRRYDVRFDAIGFDTVWVREEDFLPTGTG